MLGSQPLTCNDTVAVEHLLSVSNTVDSLFLTSSNTSVMPASLLLVLDAQGNAFLNKSGMPITALNRPGVATINQGLCLLRDRRAFTKLLPPASQTATHETGTSSILTQTAEESAAATAQYHP